MSAPQTGPAPLPCAGDISPQEAWQRLEGDPASILVDVRTKMEWFLTGQPDLSGIGKTAVCLEWMTQQGRNAGFMDELKKALAERRATPETPILFLCRTAGRSRMAAGELTAAGFRACYNVAEGFEGDLDAQGHRNSVTGWKARGLPWKQS